MRPIGPGLRASLAPLLRVVERLPASDRAAWLNDLRMDAPTVTATLEALLLETDMPEPVFTPAPSRAEMPHRLRAFFGLGGRTANA